jgi:two-component sensor histidine kinase
MSMVHEKLYQSKNLSSINIGEYFQDLIDYIKDSYNLNYRKITIKMNFENVSVLIDTATPLGLIFNELISNAIKHAFPGNRGGEINISVKKTEEEEIILSVSDNGVGFPDNYNFRESASLGIQTILALGERQLGGSVQMEDNSGVACKITFKDNIYTPRV